MVRYWTLDNLRRVDRDTARAVVAPVLDYVLAYFTVHGRAPGDVDVVRVVGATKYAAIEVLSLAEATWLAAVGAIADSRTGKCSLAEGIDAWAHVLQLGQNLAVPSEAFSLVAHEVARLRALGGVYVGEE